MLRTNTPPAGWVKVRTKGGMLSPGRKLVEKRPDRLSPRQHEQQTLQAGSALDVSIQDRERLQQGLTLGESAAPREADLMETSHYLKEDYTDLSLESPSTQEWVEVDGQVADSSVSRSMAYCVTESCSAALQVAHTRRWKWSRTSLRRALLALRRKRLDRHKRAVARARSRMSGSATRTEAGSSTGAKVMTCL